MKNPSVGLAVRGAIVERLRTELERRGRTAPAVTLSWAQSINGVIARRRGSPTRLSSGESERLTHRIRSLHAGILVGIGTVLSDDPLLSVRLVEGPQPRPVVLDSDLRTPPGCRLMGRKDAKPLIFHSLEAGRAGEKLSEAGAELIRVQSGSRGLDLQAVLRALAQRGVGSLMVEGGAGVISSFLAEALADQAVVTLSPVLTPGLSVLEDADSLSLCVDVREPMWEPCGKDMVLWGLLR